MFQLLTYKACSPEGSPGCPHLSGVQQTVFSPRVFGVTGTGYSFYKTFWSVFSQESAVDAVLGPESSISSALQGSAFPWAGRVVSRSLPCPDRRGGGTVSAGEGFLGLKIQSLQPCPRDWAFAEASPANPPNLGTQQWCLKPFRDGWERRKVFYSLKIVAPFYLCCHF